MTDPSERSRVLTLVFTDLADSTALKAERGDVPVGELIGRHRELVVRLAEECAGRIIDWAGDGCFLTFETSSAGVMFALRLQQAHAEDAELPGVRIGLHMGEVTEKAGPSGPDGPPRVEGLAVDLAARIQGLARPGQVLMSSAVYQSARQRLGVDAFGAPILWQAYGDYAIKGFDDPLDICEAGLEGLSPLLAPEASEKAQPLAPVSAAPHVEIMPSHEPSPLRRYAFIALFFVAIIAVTLGTDYVAKLWTDTPGKTPPHAGAITSLAVLPLSNLSNDPEQGYFVDGMTEAITAELAKIKSLKVISRTSAQRYRDSDLSARDIAAELDVQSLIEGSVVRDGENVRITIQLIDARTDDHLLAKSYDATLTNVLKLQSDVALAIADSIRAELTPGERERIADARAVDPEAYEAYLRGNFYYYEYTEASLARSAEAYSHAIELEPNFAAAHARLAMALWVKGWWYEKTEQDAARKRQAIAKALELDPDNDDAHVMAAWTALVDEWDWEKAEREARIALELNPNNPDAHNMLCWYYSSLAQFDDAIDAIERAIELDPLSLAWRTFLADHQSMVGQFQVCLENVDEVLELDPAYFQAVTVKSRVLQRLGRSQDALEYTRSGLILTNRHPNVLVQLAEIAAADGQIEQLREIVRELRTSFDRGSATPLHVAQGYAALGDWDQAFDWVDRALDVRDNGITLPHYPTSWRLWGHPRFDAQLDRMNYPGPYPEADAAMRTSGNAPIEKIAVLPFGNMSSDEEQEFFVDGMTEALIAELAKIKSIKVISRTSVMQYKGTDKSLPVIAAELGVDALVEGSVMKAGEEVRITAQLVNGRTDEHLWAESYTNTLENVFKLQAEVALAITDEINAVVTPQERSRIASAATVDPEAYRLYLQGRQMWSRRTPDGLTQALDLFERAIEIDPDFALAHVAIANVYVLYPDYMIDSAARSVPQAIAAANRALAIAPNLGEAFAVLGYAREIGDFDWAGAEADLRHAIDLNPGYSTAYMWLAHTLLVQGRNAESVEIARQAYQFDPLSQTVTAIYGYALVASGHVDEGMRLFRDTEPLHVNGVNFQFYRGLAAARMGDFESALKHFDNARAVFGPNDFFAGMRIAALARMGNADQAREELSLFLQTEPNDDAATGLVWALAALGESDAAFEWFDRAIQRGGNTIASTNTLGRPFVQSIMSDPRYQDGLSRMNLQTPEQTN